MSGRNRFLGQAASFLLLAQAARAGEFSVFVGPPGGIGSVRVYDIAQPGQAQSPAALQNITLLALEFALHAPIHELNSNSPRWRDDIPGAARIALPHAQGSLYRYVRSADGSDTFGFFIVDALGESRSVIEIVQPTGTPDPFVSRVAIAPDGRALLIATTPAAGGDLYEIDLPSGLVRNRTSSVAPRDFGGEGLALSTTLGIAAHATGVLRFDRASAGDAQAVPFGAPSPTWFAREVALSSNGLHAITVAGSDASAANVYVFDALTSAVRANALPDVISGAGNFPGALDGPYLAVSDDGSTCAWRTEGTKREAFMALVPQGGANTEHLTSDARFLDTLDEVGIYSFNPGGQRLSLAVGKQPQIGANEIESFDMFDVDLQSGSAPLFTNVTLSSGDPNVPFMVAPTIKPELLRRIDGAGGWLMLDRNTDELIAAHDNQSGVQVLATGIKSLDLLEGFGGALLLATRSQLGAKPRELLRVSATLTQPASVVATFGSGDDILRPALRADGWFGFVQVAPTSEFVWLYDSVGDQLRLMTNRPLHYGPSLGFAGGGELTFSVGLLGNDALFGYWPVTGAPKRVPSPASSGFVLPGA